jgi:mono/diheme cytochrome c family protein
MADFCGGTMANMKTVLKRALLTPLAGVLVLWVPTLIAQDAAGTYKAKCSACHGADASGNTPVGKMMGIQDLTSPAVQKQSDDELAGIISEGKNKMPSYKKSLKPEQIKGLVGYVRSLAKK